MSAALLSHRIPPAETPIERIKRMEQELRADALGERDGLVNDLIDIAGRCAEVATIASLPEGVKNALSKLSESIGADVQNIQSITVRNA